MKWSDVLKADRGQLLSEIERLRSALWNAGVCPECDSEISHDITEPFASCACPDGGCTEATTVPTIAGLRYDLHVTSFLLFKMTDGKAGR